jgi:hypothetical protein
VPKTFDPLLRNYSFTVSIEADEITRLKTEDARRTLGIVDLSMALSMGNTIWRVMETC